MNTAQQQPPWEDSDTLRLLSHKTQNKIRGVLTPKRMGRPPADRCLHELEKLMELGHTLEEAADIIGVSRRTLTRWKRMDTQVCEALQRGRSKLKHRLRKAQLLCAESGNAKMLIFLGKVYLDQRT